jgi:hypothetical protein
MQKSNIHELIDAYQDLFPLPPVRGICGCVFESICHLRFQEQIFIQYARMVRLPGGRAQWHSSHYPIKNQENLKERREVAYNESFTLNLRPSRARIYDGQERAPESGVYYYMPKKPSGPSQAALHSFILYDDILYIFRFTVSDEQGIEDGLIAECAELSIPEDKWVFIFVIPDGVKLLKCPYPTSLGLQRLEPCTAQIAVAGEEEPLFEKPRLTVGAEGS